MVDLEPLTQRLQQLRYVEENVRRRLAITYPDDVGLVNRAPLVERLRAAADDVAVLLRLFWLETDEPVRLIRRVLGRQMYEAALRARLLKATGGSVQARLRAEAVGSLCVWADRRFRGLDRAALRLAGTDPVYPPSSDSLMLAEVVSIGEGASVLDLCTGSAVLAMSAAGRADRVLAVDISPRAAALARINARANHVANVEVCEGDLYAPVRRTRFDVIIANPPFVVSPYDAGPSYHAGGSSGDRVLRRVVSGWSKHLQRGGRAFAISHVGLRRGTELQTVVQRWLAGFPGRARLVILERGTALDLAAAQALFALEKGTRAYAAEVRRWIDYLRRQRIESVVAFLLVGEMSEPRSLDIVDATPRILPLPLSKPAKQLIEEWLAQAPG